MGQVLVLVVMLLVAGLSCTKPDDTRHTLEELGFSNVETGGYDWFRCGDDYTFATHFTATNPRGSRVEGTVCCGFMKGCTPKF